MFQRGGTDKATLACALAPILDTSLNNADEVCVEICKDLGSSHEDRIKAGCYDDANRMSELPDRYDMKVEPDGTPHYWAEVIAEIARCA
jgi:hypothetical protein